MKTSRRWRLIIMTCLSCGSFAAAGLQGRVALDTLSAYVWRGVTYNNGTVLRPSAGLAAGDWFGAWAWANLDAHDYPDVVEAGKVSEVDVAAYLRAPLEQVDLCVGVIHYAYDRLDDRSDTEEVWASVGGALEHLAGSATLYYDIDAIDDFYAELAAGWDLELCDGLGAGVSAVIGYAGDGMAPGGEAGWSDYTLAANLTWTLPSGADIGLSLAYTDRIDDEVIPERADQVLGGLHLSQSF